MKEARSAIKLESGSGEIVLNQSGLSCRVDRFVRPFMEMTVTVAFPAEGSGEKEISFQGVVIRCNREGDGRYRLLLYFLDMDEEACRELAPYCAVNRF